MTEMRIKYSGGRDEGLDLMIESFAESIGFKERARGYSFKEKERDFAFDKENE